MRVTYGDTDVTDEERTLIDAALLRLETGAERGSWSQPVDRISLGRRLSGAGGALVFEALLHRGNEELARVVKIGPARLMHEEWKAYVSIVYPRQTAVLVGIEAATPGARDLARRIPGEAEALVYDHVKHHSGTDGLSTLEEVAAEAIAAADDVAAARVAELVSDLLDKVGRAYYRPALPDPAPRSLAEFNTTLGADLVVEVDRAATGRAWSDTATTQVGRTMPPRAVIVQARLAAPRPGPGERVTVHELQIPHDENDEDDVVGERDGMRVKLRLRPGAPGPLSPAVLGPGPFSVSGEVVSWRTADTLRRMGEALAADADPHLVDAMFAALPQVLDKEVPARVRGVVHGDLHGDNVLIAGGHPYLIDHARTHDDQPLLVDFTWLEINLMRRVVAVHMGLDDMVRLQRLLAVAAVCFPATTSTVRDAVVDRLVPAGALRPTFLILARLRWEAQRCHPAGAARFWPEYQRHLLLAAHRTLKWRRQRPEHWRASLAAGSVAAEWLGDRPLARWSEADLTEIVVDALGTPGLVSPDLTAAAAVEADRRGSLPVLETVLAEAAGALARAFLKSPGLSASGVPGPLIDLGGRLARTGEQISDAVAHLANHPAVRLAGRSGAGKSTALSVLHDKLIGDGTRIPVMLRAVDLAGRTSADAVATVLGPAAAALLDAGAVHVIVDEWHGVHGEARDAARQWLLHLRRAHPRVPVAVATRLDTEDGLTGFERLDLAEPSIPQAIIYLMSAAARRRPGTISVGRAAGLVRALLNGTEPGLRELARTPLFLSLLGRRLTRAAVPATVADLLGDHLQCSEAASAMAVTELDGATAPPVGSLAPLVDQGVLGHDLQFAFPVYRDFFAARALIDGLVPLEPRARSMRWQEAIRLYVSMAGAGEVIGLLDGADPVPVAHVLAAARPPSEHTVAFVARMTALLKDPTTGSALWARAGRALSLLGEAGSDSLTEVAEDPRTPVEARVIAVEETRSRRLVLRVLRDRSAPTEVRAAALRAARGFSDLSVLVAATLTDDAPWPVADAAHHTLRLDRIQLTPAQVTAYTAATSRRLTDIEAQLPATTTAADSRALQDERITLLTRRIPRATRLPLLLARRFAVEIHTIIGEQIDELLTDFPEPDDPDGVLHIHRRLAGDGTEIADLLQECEQEASPDPLIVAVLLQRIAADPELSGLRASALDLAQRLATALVDAGGELQGPAALLRAAAAIDAVAGLRLADRLHTALRVRGDAARLRWPWPAAMAHCRAVFTGWPTLLAGTQQDSRLAVAGLAASGFPLHAGVSPRPAWVTDEVRERLWSLRPAVTATWECVEFLRAAATAELTRALPMAVALLADPALGTLTGAMQSGVTGVHHTTARAEVLAVAGYLARLVSGDAPSPEADTWHATLSGVDTGDDPSGRVAKAIALAYLGDWSVLLTELTADPRMRTAAGNALRWWAPGPCTPADLHGPPRTAQRIAERLTAPGLGPECRDTLWEIQMREAAKAGVLARLA
ncbi:hypothetical protein [Micromonospora humida]|uniref:hypothetical protein n=1 Tax=Micromonospora humida TaxID=2809018 RepID=UPI0034319973